MSRILITGSNGQLGRELQSLAQLFTSYFFYFSIKEDLDILDSYKLQEIITSYDINTIINCAAYTDVNKAQIQYTIADSINHKAVANLAQICKEKQISLIHISTDYVFSGKTYLPITESDKTSPLGTYGLSKLKGEKSILNIGPENSIIIRTSWLYSQYGNNFVKTILKLAKERESLNVVFDQIGTPTYARDLARTILEILPRIQTPSPQIYHYSNEGAISWYDFAKAIIQIKNLPCKIHPIESKDYPMPTKRPYYCVLNKAKIKQDFGIEIPYWYDSLNICLQNIKE